jgi:starch synthase
MYAMRYGAIPIVTDVGGLHDTVEPLDVANDVGTGFVAPHPDFAGLRAAFLLAFDLYRDDEPLARASARGMEKDFSWSEPSRAYAALYAALLVSAR